jgi:D-alanyl-lipoteichoic acid acyltransferase DltB (MBOAT superfamily)
MLFNSLEFAVFFPIVTGIFFLARQEWRARWLLAASCIFYMAFIPAYISILFVTITIDYVAAMFIERAKGSKKKALLYVSIASTCLVLVAFKYLSFFTNILVSAAGAVGCNVPHPVIEIVLPIGLSFHTFQSLSYVIEVYRGNQTAERNFVIYATYVMFFPQLVAGPIERPQNLLHQFREWHVFDYTNVTCGLKRMAWGLFKKVVVADRLALYVNDVYGSPRDYSGLQLTLATVFFAYQIYCDFSGYSDIAIGAAQVLGFRLMENFNTPYYSLSISEFWRRWHISLSSWFKDYLYIPLGGSRLETRRHIANVLVTFGISGLWHGANWTYLCWGLLNGLYLIVGWLTRGWRNRLFETLGLSQRTVIRKAIMLLTTLVLTCVAWIVFRARNLEDAAYVITHVARGWSLAEIRSPHFLLRQLPVAIAAILAVEIGQLLQVRTPVRARLAKMPLPGRWALYAACVIIVLMFGIYQKAQFIYFQF